MSRMACVHLAGVVVCRPGGVLRRSYSRCPTCERITEQVTRYEVWYDPQTWCTRCGDSWAGGELVARPFARGWRRDAVRWARALWDAATYGGTPQLAELDPQFAAEMERR